MFLPYLAETSSPSKKYTVAFRGINYGEGHMDGEMSECQNLSSEQYPCISQRAARVKVGQYEKPHTIHAKEELMVIDGTNVFFNERKVGEVTDGRKQTATIGNYIVIFPDKKYYNVVTDTFGSMEETFTASGLVFTSNTITTTEKFNFRDGDAIEISGCVTKENNKTPIIRGVSETVLTFDDNTFTAVTEEGEVTIRRNVPDLDFICESNYRLWGTKGNTIYSSKFSDPFNFFVFDGLSSDSYYIDVGSDGEFTGCIPYSSHLCFFKENTLHKLYGTKPSNFQIVTVNIYGVQSGCERSMCIVNEQLLYKGVDGVYAYTGGVPELISGKFGTRRYSEASATCDGERYYISMRRDGEWNLFVYDVLKNIWLREDDTKALDMAFFSGKVFFIGEYGELYCIDRTASRDDIEWSAAFCPFNETVNERKGYSKFHMRVDMSAKSWLAVDVKADYDTQWKEVFKTHNERAKTISIPIIPTRCDSVTVRVRGKGECVIKSFVREFTMGSDV